MRIESAKKNGTEIVGLGFDWGFGQQRKVLLEVDQFWINF